MKLKKILASLTAAAMAVSVMAFSPAVSQNLTVNAEGEETLVSAGAIPDGKSAVITLDCSTELQNDWDYKYSAWEIIVKTWSNADDAGDWTKMGVGGSEQKQYYNGAPYIVYSGSEIVDGSLTANFTVQPKDAFEVLYKSDDKYDVTIKTVKVYDEADGAGNVLYTWTNPDLDTTEYAAQDITTEFNADYNTMTFDGTFDASKVSGPKARIEITFTPTAETNDSLVKIIDNSDPNNINWDGIASVNNNGTTDKQTASIKLSSFTLPSSIILNSWHVASIESVVIYNDKTKGNVYSLSSGEEVVDDSLSFTSSNVSLKVGDDSAKTKLELKSGRTDFTPEISVEGTSATVEMGEGNTLIITPVSEGVTTITAKVTIPDTDDYAGGSYTATCTVTVSKQSAYVPVSIGNVTGISVSVALSSIRDAVDLSIEDIERGAMITLDIKGTDSSSDRFNELMSQIEERMSARNARVDVKLDITLYKVIGDIKTTIQPKKGKTIPVKIGIPDYDPDREYLGVTLLDDEIELLDTDIVIEESGAFAEFGLRHFSPYAIISRPRTNTAAVTTGHRIVIGTGHVYTNAASAAPGAAVRVFTDFGYDARVYAGGRLIACLRSGDTFIMPDSDVSIAAVPNMDSALLLNAKPVSYIFVYDTDMNEITVSSSRKSKTDGEITVKLGAEYAGRTVTLYSGRKDTTDMITSAAADKNGNVTFSVDLGENYTAVVE